MQAGAEPLRRTLGLLSLAADRTGHPVLRTEVVEDRAADALHVVRLETQAALGVELLDRVDEPEDARLHEIAHVDVGGQPCADPAGTYLTSGA